MQLLHTEQQQSRASSQNSQPEIWLLLFRELSDFFLWLYIRKHPNFINRSAHFVFTLLITECVGEWKELTEFEISPSRAMSQVQKRENWLDQLKNKAEKLKDIHKREQLIDSVIAAVQDNHRIMRTLMESQILSIVNNIFMIYLISYHGCVPTSLWSLQDLLFPMIHTTSATSALGLWNLESIL